MSHLKSGAETEDVCMQITVSHESLYNNRSDFVLVLFFSSKHMYVWETAVKYRQQTYKQE